MANPDPSTLWTIRVPAVRWGLERLGIQKIHSTFLMYLYLRLRARKGLLAESSPSSDEMKSLLLLPGNPEKPYYFPMIDRGPRDVGPLPSFWRATNVAGMWSAATLGRSRPLDWLTDGQGNYAMPADNANLAFKNLLFETPAPALAMGAFFLRDAAFVSDQLPTARDLVDTFRERFGFPRTEELDFVKLFDPTVPGPPAPDVWFEAAAPSVLERLIG